MFVKRHPTAPPGFFACEAAGLQWLSSAPGGVACAQVLDVNDTSLTLQRLESTTPTENAALQFGARLARTHNAGAAGFGAPPQGWSGPGFFGPLDHPLPMTYATHPRWGLFYAEERLAPMLERARPRLEHRTVRDLDTVMRRCAAGDFDDDDAAARLHGDLWSGNVLWTADGVVLIDPAAHGGHRETDLAMLALFGCPHLPAVVRGYQSVHRLREGWQVRVGLHQLYPLLAHVVLFGGGYAGEVARAARELS